ncbi:asparagine synthase (glutamine-hydrolyzing) [Oxalobacteraceae bacterium OTU3REALA1]|nr:asparagine synthase (glutamine-hydrolyzing) [Oxalobacteraceae bacterium OTU3REALA1]
MCGIAAISKRGGYAEVLPLLRSMCEAVAHRGPNGAGYSLQDNGQVGLASVRLGVMDLVDGDQPLFNEDRSVVVVCNGEIYDYARLRSELERAGHRCRTRSDSELIVHLYEAYGDDFVSFLNGEFAFILYDSKRKRLLAARDRAGVRPLYFHWTEDRLLLCSEVKGIFRDPTVHRRISSEYIFGAALGAVHDDACAFEGIHTVRPGHMLVLELYGAPVQRPFHRWTFELNDGIDFSEAARRVGALVIKSVHRRAVADVPVHCYLSGGIDSAIVCSVLSSGRSDVRAYHASFPESAYSETAEAQEIATYCGVELNTVECSGAAMLDSIISTVRHVELPLPNCNSVAKFLLSRFVNSDGTKVCLNGEGADEMFGGYPFFKLEALWRATLSSQWKGPSLKAASRSLAATDSRSLGSVWNPIPNWQSHKRPYGWPNYLHLACRANGGIVPLLSGFRLTGSHLENEFLCRLPPESYVGLNAFNVTRRMAMHRLAGGILPLLGDRVEMAHGVECRTPFLDPELLDLLSTLPEMYFIDLENMTEKRILRSAFSGTLPPKTLNAPKHPFLAPLWRMTLNSPKGRQLLGDVLSRTSVREAGLFAWPAVACIKAAWQALPPNSLGVRRLDPLIGILLTTHILYEVLVKAGPTSASSIFPMVDKGALR